MVDRPLSGCQPPRGHGRCEDQLRSFAAGGTGVADFILVPPVDPRSMGGRSMGGRSTGVGQTAGMAIGMDNLSDGVTVFGSATVSTPVDRVAITLAVEIVRPDAGEAYRLAADTVTRLLAVLADDGVDARAVRTLDLSLGPRTE